MRKKPDIPPKICQMCGKEYKPNSTVQIYCKECGTIRDKERKKAWYIKTHGYHPKTKSTDVCCICGKGPERVVRFEGKPYCNKHYLRMKTWGDVELHPRGRTNQYIVEGNLLRIVTKKGETILADAADLNVLNKHSWCISKTGYPVANINKKTIKLHRYLLGLTDPDVLVDHKNNNPLDNRRDNLRICTARENGWNQSGNSGRKLPVGIRITPAGRYVAVIQPNKKHIHLGTFDTLEEAATARRDAELKYFGDFAQHLYR